jgi:hypothetical protein
VNLALPVHFPVRAVVLVRALVPVAFLADALSIAAQFHALPIAVLAGIRFVALLGSSVAVTEFFLRGFFFRRRSKCHGCFIVLRWFS